MRRVFTRTWKEKVRLSLTHLARALDALVYFGTLGTWEAEFSVWFLLECDWLEED